VSDFLYNFCLKHFSFLKEKERKKNQQDIIPNLYMSSYKVPIILVSDFSEMKPNIFSADLQKSSNTKFHEICYEGAKLSRVDRLIDRGMDGRTDGGTDRYV